jgi:5-methylcytosine-specific restriction endonuclease McrA
MSSAHAHRRYRANRKRVLSGQPVCWICGKPIDTTQPHYIVNDEGKRSLNPLAPSADHVIAVTKGGGHEPSNLKPAHLGCNMRKSNKAHANIIRRSTSLD